MVRDTCRAPEWFARFIPRVEGVAVRLAADAADLLDLTPEVQEAAACSFIINGILTSCSPYVVASPEQVETACALLERTCPLMFEPRAREPFKFPDEFDATRLRRASAGSGGAIRQGFLLPAWLCVGGEPDGPRRSTFAACSQRLKPQSRGSEPSVSSLLKTASSISSPATMRLSYQASIKPWFFNRARCDSGWSRSASSLCCVLERRSPLTLPFICSVGRRMVFRVRTTPCFVRAAPATLEHGDSGRAGR